MRPGKRKRLVMNYYSICLSKFADFSGRARRREYWTFALVNCLIALLLLILGLAFGEDSPASNIMVTIFYLIMLVPNLSVSVRRLHDIGKSGWWLFIGLIPLVGSLLLLVWSLMDSEEGENQYGENPKGGKEQQNKIKHHSDGAPQY